MDQSARGWGSGYVMPAAQPEGERGGGPSSSNREPAREAMSSPDDSGYRGPKFVGIKGHDNVSHNGSKTTVYFVQVQVGDAMFVVKHRYHEFKDFFDKLTGEGFRCPVLPPKKFLGSFNKEFIERRQQELANWLHLLCAYDPASGTADPRTSELFKEFMLTNVRPPFALQGKIVGRRKSHKEAGE
ncbi:hypothetical protein BBJ28_00005695 [Nothophytophthora sp. Chile5]|nr:hypothetical protein BBJ28_00005695 [Nothophytophthora sp. Chile5]